MFSRIGLANISLIIGCLVVGCDSPGEEATSLQTSKGTVVSVTSSVVDMKKLESEMNRRFPIIGVNFKSSNGHVFENEEVESYRLHIPPKLQGRAAIFNGYGEFIQFDKRRFTARNYTSCGNDVSIVSVGAWEWVAENRIKIFVESIQRNEYCNKPSEDPKKVIGVFELSWENETRTAMQLIRVGDGG